MLTQADLPRFELDGESLVRPDFAGRGLANVAPTVLRLLAPEAATELDLPPLHRDVLPESIASGVKTLRSNGTLAKLAAKYKIPVGDVK